MKVTINIPKNLILKALALAGASDSMIGKVVAATAENAEVDITNLCNNQPEAKDLPLAIAMAAIGKIVDP